LEEMRILQPGALDINSARIQLRQATILVLLEKNLSRLNSLPEEVSSVFSVSSIPFILTI